MQRIVRIGVGGLVGVSAAIMLLVGGCQDDIPFPTVPTPGSTSSSSGGGSGGDGGGGAGGNGGSSVGGAGGNPSVCVSNTDCVTPIPICDVPKGQCVECLAAADCALKPGTVCSGGTCACPTPGDSYCLAPARCIDLQTSSADCGSCDHPCFGSCVAGKCADAWEPTPWKDAPSARSNHVAVWTGSEMIVWGGDVGGGNTNTGGMLNVAGYKWKSTSTSNAPTSRKEARAVWTGTKMIVWGGDNGGALQTGGVFDPVTNTWTATTTVNAPSPRYGHSIVWTGTKMLVWGGTDGINYYGDGAAYDVGADTWETIPPNGLPPSARAYHSAVWTGTDMVVFGGYGFNGLDFGYLGDGGEFDPNAASWVSVKDGQPPARARHGSAWTGTEMIIWGGQDSANSLSPTGARYKPKIEWSVITSDSAPELRQFHTHVWIAPQLIVWGGQNVNNVQLSSGALYDPVTNSWSKKPIPSGPTARTQHSSVNASGKLIIFGGSTPSGLTNTGAILDPTVL
ncbi:MAG: hypothetical protein IPM54_16455 [Polyangiaceae bacterium]|nr:hypothetical protein [Polyangiaceae bacterium]